MTETKPRAKKVSHNDFFTGYITGCKEGLTEPEIAAKLEMNVASMRARASQARSAYAEEGIVIPSPAGGGLSAEEKRKENVSFLTDLISGLDDTDE